MPNGLKNIEEEYKRYAAKQGLIHSNMPYGTTPDNFGGEHLEVYKDGKMALVGTDRGLETSRKETYSLDELLYWMFSAKAYSLGWNYEISHRQVGRDSRRIAFSKALEEIEKFNPTWRERLKSEQDDILQLHPYIDKL